MAAPKKDRKHNQLGKEEIINLAEKTVKNTLKQGADEAEAYISITSQTSVGIRNGQLVRNTKSMEQGLAVRVVYNKALGFTFTNILEEDKIQEITGRALSIVRVNKSDKNWPGFPAKARFAQPKETFDKKLVKLPPEELVHLASTMLESVTNYDKRVLAVQGRAGVAYETTAIANSSGVEAWDESTAIACGVATIAREKMEMTPACFDFAVERTYNIEPSKVGKEAARQAVSSLKAKSIKSGSYPAIFTALAFQDLLSYTFMEAVKADRVQREQSVLKGKIGEKVASEHVTICDDGLFAGGLQTSKFDGEGTPHRRTPIIEKGVLRHFLYDRYAAKRDDVESTGNADRRIYMVTPTISPTNFVLKQGAKTPQKLLDEVNDGLLVYYLQGGQSSNPLTGEFSVIATPAWKIEKGEIAYPVKEVMLAGTIFDLLNSVSALANNVRKLEHLVAPWIRVEDVKIIGKQ